MNNRPEQSRSFSSTGILGWLLNSLYRALKDILQNEPESQDDGPRVSSPITREQLLLEQWKLASELHRHQDILIWNQVNYFVAFNLALFPLIGVVWSFLQDTPYAAAFMSLLMALTGGFVSNTWRKAHARQTAYHKYRIKQADEVEAALKVKGERVLTLYEETVDDQPWFKEGEKAQTEWKEARTKISDLISRLTLWMIRLWALLGGIFLGVLITSI